MIDKLSAQQRLVLAGVLSILVFVAYGAIMPQPKIQDTNKTTTTSQQTTNENVAPVSTNSSPTSNTKPIDAPVQSKNTTFIATIKSKDFEIKIDELGRIDKYYLNDKKYNEKKSKGGIYALTGKDKDTTVEGIRAQLIDQNLAPKPLEVRFSDVATNNEAFAKKYSADRADINLNGKEQTLVLTQQLSNLTITKTLTFSPDGNIAINMHLSAPKEYFVSPGARPSLAVDGYTFHGILIQKADDSLEVIDDGDDDKYASYNNITMLAAADKYYTTLFYSFDAKGLNAVVSKGSSEADMSFIRGNGDMNFNGYIGPKDHKELAKINPRLTNVVEYGWFTFIAKPVFKFLSYIHNMFGNWGWSIVVMTILFRIILFPLTYKGMVSMNKMKELAPKMKELQAKYKDDKQKLNMHVMELYKKHGANPMGGCLPIILQIPIFFAIYRVLQNAVELKDAPWILWINDLSILDPWFILPILMGLTMYLQQRLTPTNFTDPMQEKIMKFLPLIFTFFFFTFPAGLTLYWVTNNTFSVLQQIYVNKIFAKHKQEEIETHKNKKVQK